MHDAVLIVAATATGACDADISVHGGDAGAAVGDPYADVVGAAGIAAGAVDADGTGAGGNCVAATDDLNAIVVTAATAVSLPAKADASTAAQELRVVQLDARDVACRADRGRGRRIRAPT